MLDISSKATVSSARFRKAHFFGEGQDFPPLGINDRLRQEGQRQRAGGAFPESPAATYAHTL